MNEPTLWKLSESWPHNTIHGGEISHSHVIQIGGVDKHVDHNVRWCHRCQLQAALRAWDKQIEEGIKHVSSPIGPLHSMGMVTEAESTRKHVLGVPLEVPDEAKA